MIKWKEICRDFFKEDEGMKSGGINKVGLIISLLILLSVPTILEKRESLFVGDEWYKEAFIVIACIVFFVSAFGLIYFFLKPEDSPSQDKLRNLTHYLEKTREEERTRISREIHDELGQQLTALKFDLNILRKKYPDITELKEKLEEMNQLVNETMSTVRKISSELRPGVLDDLGLIAAIEWQCSEFQQRTGKQCILHNSVEDLEFTKDVSTAVFRIIQEALTNVIRHSHANKINIYLKENSGKLAVSIKDNGRGITNEEIETSTSLGLLGIRERTELLGGKFKISGELGKGTEVSLLIPLAA